jgi:hypothetical protein
MVFAEFALGVFTGVALVDLLRALRPDGFSGFARVSRK